jgi:dihydrofolate reductase
MEMIFAMDQDFAMGNNDESTNKYSLLWRIPEDMRRFRAITEDHVVVMGRKTFESIGKPLPRRINLVLSSRPPTNRKILVPAIQSEIIYVTDVYELFSVLHGIENRKIFVIGGTQIYTQLMPFVDKIHVTHIRRSNNISREGNIYISSQVVDEMQKDFVGECVQDWTVGGDDIQYAFHVYNRIKMNA